MQALTRARDFILSGNSVATDDTVASDSLERQALSRLTTASVPEKRYWAPDRIRSAVVSLDGLTAWQYAQKWESIGAGD